MVENTAEGGPLNWRLPVYAAAGACIVFLLVAIYGSDLEFLLYSFAVAPIVGLALVVFAVGRRSRQRLSALLMLVAWVVVTGALTANYGRVRPTLRWLLWSQRYRAELLAAPDSTNGEFKHIEWDGWGWAGQGTVVYLVFDPTDSLSAAATTRSPGRFRGIPCEVPLVRRLERQWYSVLFYTNTDWGHCP